MTSRKHLITGTFVPLQPERYLPLLKLRQSLMVMSLRLLNTFMNIHPIYVVLKGVSG